MQLTSVCRFIHPVPYRCCFNQFLQSVQVNCCDRSVSRELIGGIKGKIVCEWVYAQETGDTRIVYSGAIVLRTSCNIVIVFLAIESISIVTGFIRPASEFHTKGA